MLERAEVRGKTRLNANLYFQIRSQPRLARVFGRPRRPEFTGAIPPLARGRRGQAGFRPAQQSQPRRDREVDRQRRLSAVEAEGRQEVTRGFKDGAWEAIMVPPKTFVASGLLLIFLTGVAFSQAKRE